MILRRLTIPILSLLECYVLESRTFTGNGKQYVAVQHAQWPRKLGSMDSPTAIQITFLTLYAVGEVGMYT